MNYDYLIVGAGFAGAVMAERLASQLDKKVILVEKRNHIGGNAYDEYDEHGILVHRYGPHIFHTNSKEVFDYLSHFTDWRFYEHKVLANLKGELYPIPINRTTINKIYNKSFTNKKATEDFLNSIKEQRNPVLNSEDVIVNQVGYILFDKFFRHYTKKQWYLEPKDLLPSVCGRILVRTNIDDRYFADKYQFMPKEGYTKMFEKMLRHKNIEILLNTDYKTILDEVKFHKIIYTGPIDYFFDYKYGQLPYRSIKFEYESMKVEYYQGSAQINYVGNEVAYTRVVEHKYLSSQKTNSTTISREYPQLAGEPFYPIPTEENKEHYKKYKAELEKTKNVTFCGRLAEYQYLNMDQVVTNCFHIIQDL